MFQKVDSSARVGCQIVGLGHSRLEDSDKFRVVSQKEFIQALPKHIQEEVCKDGKSIDDVAATWSELISPDRTFFDGHIADLGELAMKRCFNDAWDQGYTFDPFDIDAIIGATNTGPEYPSLADYIKEKIGLKSRAMCFDVTEACTSGSVAILQANALITSGICKRVLVVCAEKATTLAPFEDWQGSNLFGDASFAMLLQATREATEPSFDFFEFNSFPLKGNLELIKKTEHGFEQNGKKVHLFVIDKVVDALVESVTRAGIDYTDIKHLVLHQPSKKTVSSMKKELMKRWPNFQGIFHESEGIGNASSASFGHLLSTKYHAKEIKFNELVVTCTFGAGLSLGIIGLHLDY
jgi:3-oxoacyl-[acyl-carrier-protein] synthase-3